LLDSSCQDIFNGINDVVIEDLVCLCCLFLYFFFPLFSFLSSHVRLISLLFFEMSQFWIATSLKVTFSNRGKYKLCVNSFYSVILPVLKKIANFQRKKILKIVSEEMHLTFYDHITQFRCCLFWNPTVLLKKFEFFNLI
jgi:hypothetical protein